MIKRALSEVEQVGPTKQPRRVQVDSAPTDVNTADLVANDVVTEGPDNRESGSIRPRPSGTIQSVVRAMSILERCAEEPNGATARQIALADGLSVPTASHLLSTLAYCGYLKKTGTRYALSWKIAELHSALSKRFTPSERAIETMNELVAITGETAYISSWIDGDVVVAAVAEGHQAVRVAGVSLGMRGAAHSRASGKILLGLGPADRFSEYVSTHPLTAFTDKTIIDPVSLREAVELAQRDGYALDRGERFDGVCCVAIPLAGLGPSATIAASVMVPEARFEHLVDGYLDRILALSR